MIPPKDDPNIAAVTQFYNREVERKSVSKQRILLHLVGKAETRHIEVIDEETLSPWAFVIHRLKLLFRPAEYHIQEIKQFLDDRQIQLPPEIQQTIDEKVSHAQKNFIAKAWKTIFGGKKKEMPAIPTSPKSAAGSPPGITTITPGEGPAYTTQLNDFLDNSLALEKAEPEQVRAFGDTLRQFRDLAKKHPELAPYELMASEAFERKLQELRPPKVAPGVAIRNIEKQAGDGNCLLRSFAVAFGLKTEDHPTFRKEAADWLEKNWKSDETLRGSILVAIKDNNEAEDKLYNENKPFLELVSKGEVEGIDEPQKKGAIDRLAEVEARFKERFIPPTLTEEERIERYISLSRKETFFCDNPHIIALSHKYNVSIEVYNTQETPGAPLELVKDKNSGCALPDPFGLIRLHYDRKGAHYNAIVSVPSSDIDSLTKKLEKLTFEEGVFGIANPGINTCYLNAPIQALRVMEKSFMPWLQEQQKTLPRPEQDPLIQVASLPAKQRYEIWSALLNSFDVASQEAKQAMINPALLKLDLKDKERLLGALVEVSTKAQNVRDALFKQPLLFELQQIFTLLESGAVDADTIKAFRQLVRLSGLHVPEEKDQQDTNDFLSHLLEALGLEKFSYKITSEVVGVDDKMAVISRIDQSNHIDLGLGLGNAGSLKELVSIGAQKFLFLSQEKVPQILPLRLNRFAYEGAGKKVQTPVEPSPVIDIGIESQPEAKARFRLKAVTLHEGETIEAGHYVSYIPTSYEPERPQKWIRFDDTAITRVANSDRFHKGWQDEHSILDEVKRNGYIYFYEFEGISQASSG